MLFSLNLLNLWFSIQKSMAFIVPLSDVLLYGLEPAMESVQPWYCTSRVDWSAWRGGRHASICLWFEFGCNICPSHLKSVRVSRDHAGICFSDLLSGYSFKTFEGGLNWNMPGDNSLLWLRTQRQTGNLFVSIEAQVNVLQLQYFLVNFPDLINTIILVIQKYFKLMLIHFYFRELHSLYLI